MNATVRKNKSTRLNLVGGFLGAGKTTLLLESARWLSRHGYRVGLVTNDQSEQLVDIKLAHDADIPVTEVAGGCFCCRFPDLIKALHTLQHTVDPDLIRAEPVGSCTDLVATVLRPLSYYYGEHFTLAPLTVLVAADHIASHFSTRVDYLYKKQLAEAEHILLNKSDLLSPEETARRVETLRPQVPGAQVRAISARLGSGIEPWLTSLLATPSRLNQNLELDYATYAEAEAELGWLNCRGTLWAESPFPAEEWISSALLELSHHFATQQVAVAHMKMHLYTPRGVFKASITAAGGLLSWDSRVQGLLIDRAQFVFNVRVAASPQALEQAVRTVLNDSGSDWRVRSEFTHFECFRPAPPKPTHRLGPLFEKAN